MLGRFRYHLQFTNEETEEEWGERILPSSRFSSMLIIQLGLEFSYHFQDSLVKVGDKETSETQLFLFANLSILAS